MQSTAEAVTSATGRMCALEPQRLPSSSVTMKPEQRQQRDERDGDLHGSVRIQAASRQPFSSSYRSVCTVRLLR